MPCIVTSYKSYSFDEIKHHGNNLLKNDDPVFNQTFTLAQQWLNGTGIFTFHTSGSTGNPKEIYLTRTQLEASARGTIEVLGLTSSEHILLCMNSAFIGGAMLLIRGLMLNVDITLQQPSGNPLQQIAVEHPYTFASFTPMQLHALIQEGEPMQEKLNRFNHILVGGAAIPFRLEKELEKLTTKVYHTYGMTETVSHIALKQIGKGIYFKTLPGVELSIDDRDCLMIRSASTNLEWVVTNDVVRMIDESTFELLGRFDDVINTGGIKVWPPKIEQALQETILEAGIEISNLFVSWTPDERLGQKIIAVIEGEPIAENVYKQIIELLGTRLAKYEMPRSFYYLPSFVLSPTGKTNKHESLKMIDLRT